MAQMDVWVGIDGGGSGTRLAAVDERGQQVAEGTGPSSNLNHFSQDAVRDAFRSAGSCLERYRVQGVSAGGAGLSTAAEIDTFQALLREALHLPRDIPSSVRNDTAMGVEASLGGNGICLVAGTGSACFGKNTEEETAWAGGWGALADDAGSGYWIAVEALKLAVRMEDGREASNGLTGAVFGFLGLSEPRQLLDRVHTRGISRDELAKLAPLVMDMPEGEPVVRSAALRLDELVATVRGKLWPPTEEIRVLAVGGILNPESPVRRAMVTRLEDPKDGPALANARLSLREHGGRL